MWSREHGTLRRVYSSLFYLHRLAQHIQLQQVCDVMRVFLWDDQYIVNSFKLAHAATKTQHSSGMSSLKGPQTTQYPALLSFAVPFMPSPHSLLVLPSSHTPSMFSHTPFSHTPFLSSPKLISCPPPLPSCPPLLPSCPPHTNHNPRTALPITSFDMCCVLHTRCLVVLMLSQMRT